MKKLFLLGSFILLAFSGLAQSDSLSKKEIEEAQKRLDEINRQEQEMLRKMELIKFNMVQQTIATTGFPILSVNNIQVIKHACMVLAYDEQHEQARWVMHVILPEVATGNVSRTNDFRMDSLVSTGTAGKDDYWHSGYDRGHLAPSADFKWSHQALSESYYYSNMSPQRPELNRQRWSQLEDLLRAYVVTYQHKLIVVTGPLLHDTLKQIGPNGVSVPYFYYKVAIDPASRIGIGFIMPNKTCPDPVLSYAVSIDSVELLTGYNFFPSLNTTEETAMEGKPDINLWKVAKEEGHTEPLNAESLPKGKFNTIQAKYHVGDKVSICGTVVSTKFSEKSGATFINLDRKFPDQIFTVQIWKDSRVNFSYKPEEFLMNKVICVTGKVEEREGNLVMTISNESQIEIIEE
jgi:endonuclease G